MNDTTNPDGSTTVYTGQDFKATRLWEHAGLTCALSHGIFGCPCGYVTVPGSHPLHRVKDGDRRLWALSVHGGVSWAQWLDRLEAGLPHLWAIGFDTAHGGDLQGTHPDYRPLWSDERAIAETERLADQLAALMRDVPAAADEG